MYRSSPTTGPTSSNRSSVQRNAARTLLVVLVTVMLLPLLPMPAAGAAQACTISWDGGAGTIDWHHASNWTEDRLPAPADVACISHTVAGNEVYLSADVPTVVAALQTDNWIVLEAGELVLQGDSYSMATRLDGGILTVATRLDTQEFDQNGGLIDGAGLVRVGGFFRWEGGAQWGPGRTEIFDAGGGFGGLLMEGAGTRTALGRTIDAQVGMLMEGGTLELDGDSLLHLRAPSGATGDGGVIKSNGPGRVQVDSELIVQDSNLSVTARFDTGNQAAVQVKGDQSFLTLAGGGEQHGSFFMEGGTSVDLQGGSFTFHDDAPITAFDDGAFHVSADDVDATVLGTYAVGTTDLLTGTLRVPEGADLGVLQVQGGTLDVTGAATADSAAHDEGTVTGDGTLTVVGDYQWARGTQAGAGATVVEGALELHGAGIAHTIEGRSVGGELVDWIDAGTLDMKGTAPSFWATDQWISGVAAVVAQAQGSDALFQPGNLVMDEDAHLTVHARVLTEPDEIISMSGTNTFLDLRGGGEFNGTIESNGTMGVNVGGAIAFNPESQITLGPDGFGIYEGADVQFGGAQMVAHEINNSGTMRVQSLVNVGEVINHGTVVIEDTKTLWLESYTQPSEEAVTWLDGPEARLQLTETGLAAIELGVLEGSGIVDGDLISGGVVMPHGELDVTGNYTQVPDGVLLVETDGDASDRLTVAGSADIKGLLQVNLGGVPATQPLQTLQAAILTGTFDEVVGADPCWDVVYDPTGVYVWPQPCVTIGAGSGVEDLGVAAFPVTLSAVHDVPVTVTYATQNGTALADQDFVAESGTVTIPAGQTEATITIDLIPDEDDEDDEDFSLAVSATGGALADSSVGAVIIDDDTEETPTELQFSVEEVPTWGEYDGIEATSRKYLVGWSDFDNLGTRFAWYYNLDTGTFSYWPDVVWAGDTNDRNQLVGDCGEPNWTTACFRSDKINHDVAAPAGSSVGLSGINNDGVFVGSVHSGSGDSWVTEAAIWTDHTQPPHVIGLFPGSSDSWAMDINDNGVVLGEATVGSDQVSWIWSEATGFIEIPKLGDLPGSRASAINNAGVVVGGAYEPVAGGARRAWSWTAADGIVDLGNGFAHDVNNQGEVVGFGDDGHGTLWRDGETHDLNDGISADLGLLVGPAHTINDDGQISAFGYRGGGMGVVALQPPVDPDACVVCLTVGTEEKKFPTGEWINAGASVIDGTPMRFTATVENTDIDPHTVQVTFEGPDGEPIEDEDLIVTVEPGASEEVSVEWDTTGLAWEGSTAASTQFVDTQVFDQATDEKVDQLAVGTNIDPRPMVLVHGLWSDESTWASYPQMLAAVHPGWRSYAVDTMDTTSFVPNLVWENAAALDTYLDGVQLTENAWQVDIVAHSMGGLVSRYYIQELMPQFEGKNSVANLVMLGTPNGGSPCAELAIVPATYELRPDVVAEFNANITDRKGVPFSVAAGIDMPVTCHAPLPGDDVVPVESAELGMEDTLLFDIAHTSMTGSQMLFDQWVRPHLDGSSSPLAPASEAAASPAAADGAEAAAVGAGDDVQLLDGSSRTVAAGETVDVPLTNDSDLTELGVMAMAPASLEVRLVRDGETAATTGSDPEATATTFRSVSVADPADGEWSVELQNHGTADVDVPFSIWIEGSPTSFAVAADQVGTSGKAQLTATITGSEFVEWPSVTAQVYDGDEIEEIELWDDGQHGDGEESDLVFGGSATGLGSGGHLVVVRASAPWFSRVATASLEMEVIGDTPGNDAPTALAQELTLGRDTSEWVELAGDDPDGDELSYEIVTLPAHGVVQQGEGGSASVHYIPAHHYMGSDSFTYRAFDGLLYSPSVTVSITVDRAPTELDYDGPWPSSGAQGTTITAWARLLDPLGNGAASVPVDFTFGDQVIHAETNNAGRAAAEISLDVTPGQHELAISFPGTDVFAPSATTRNITVEGGVPPAPTILEPVDGEAGYPVRIFANPNDPDGNVEHIEFDFEDDGTFDVEVDQGEFGGVSVDHVYPDAFEGQLRLRVTDATGQVGEATTPVTIAPHRPLGALQRLEVDGARVRSVDLSADGRFVLYQILDDEDGQALPTPYGVLDIESGEHELVSFLPDGGPVEFPGAGVLSRDGRFVAFTRGETVNGKWTMQSYLRDRQAGTTIRVSLNDDDVPVNGGSAPVAISADGRFVLLSSIAQNMTDQDIMTCGTLGQTLEPCDQLYLRDVEAGTTTLVSKTADGTVRGGHYWADMTEDASQVVFESRDELVIWDRAADTTEVLDITTDGEKPEDETGIPTITNDGRYVLFESAASNIVDGDTNENPDVFRHDRQTGETIRVSLTDDDGQADSTSSFPEMSCDGSVVVFWSYATDLVDDDTNGISDIFVRDLAAGTTRRISVEPRDGLQADFESTVFPRISADGSRIVFESEATNLVPGDVNGGRDPFLLDTGISRECSPESAAPAVTLAEPASIVEGSEVELSATGNDPDGDPLTFTWEADGGELEAAGPTATLSVADGPADISVTVTVSDGTLDGTDTVTVPVTNAAPDVDAGDDISAMVGEEVSLSGSASDAGPADEAAGLEATWDLGNGGTATGLGAKQTYATAGTYTATLTVEDKDGAIGTDSLTVTVSAAPTGVPGPPLDVSAIGGNANATVQWEPPLSDGGSPVTGYELVVSPGGATYDVGDVSTTVVAGLTNGVDYTFAVRARNANGYGPFSAASNVARPRAVCTEDAFTDVPDDHPFCPEIDWMADNGIAEGWADGTYRPGEDVTRQAMIAFAYRLAGAERGPDPGCTVRPFADVPVESSFCGEITWARDAGITTGFEDGQFRPAAPVSRQAMAAFLYRMAGSPRGADPVCTTDEFTDVTTAHPFCGEIDWLVDSGLAAGYDDGRFRPGAAISRQAMAAFVFRYDVLTGVIG